MIKVETLLSSQQGLTLGGILILSYVLGLLRGITSDQNYCPLAFSYALGKLKERSPLMLLERTDELQIKLLQSARLASSLEKTFM